MKKLMGGTVSEIVVVVHGFMASKSQWQFSLKAALVTEPSRVVVVTNWGKGAGKSFVYYKQAAANTRYVGVIYTLYYTVLYCTVLYCTLHTPGTWG